MQQKISPLSNALLADIESKRYWVKNHYTPDAITQYDTISGKFKLLDTILNEGWYSKEETLQLQSLGVTLGDIFIQDMGFHWIEVEDEFGTTAALQLDESSIIIYPVTMISKRVENDEDVDIYDLYDQLKKHLQQLILNKEVS